MSAKKCKKLIETEFKTPKKSTEFQCEEIQTIEQFGLKESPQILQNRSIQTLKNEIKQEEKVNQIIRKIELDDDQIVIKRDSSQIRQKRSSCKEYKVQSSYTLDLFNSIEIRKDNTIVNKLQKITQDDINYNESFRNETVICKCKKTKCVKLYCECYQFGQECSFKCECTGCCNKQPKIINQKYQQISTSIEFIGCKCQKQDCSKKYCECLKRKQKCTIKCKCCEECKNQENGIFVPQILDFNALLNQFEEQN